MTTDQLKILHIDSGREWRGGQRQALLLMEGLARRGHAQWLAVMPEAPLAQRVREALGSRVTLIPMNLKAGGGVFSARQLRGIVEDEGVRLCAVHDAHAHHVAAAMTLGWAELPVAVHRRVDFALRGNLLSRWKYQRPNMTYIAISSGVRDVLAAGGVAPEKIHVVHSSFDPRRWAGPFDAGRVRVEFGIAEGAPVVGNVAALVDHKDHLTLVNAAHEILAAAPDAHMIIVGEGEDRGRLERRIAELGLGGRIHLAGWRDNVGDFLAAFACFALSSHLEGLCTSLLDAMACRVPVVATNTGGVPDLVRDGETGLLVPPRDSGALARSVARVLGDAALRERLISQAHQFAMKDFTPERMVEKTETIYRSLVSQ